MLDLNPWKTIWTEPRATIVRIVNENPNRSIWALAAIYGFSAVLNFCQTLMLGYNVGLPGIFLLAVILAPLWGYVSFSVWSYIVTFVGKWLKGVGSFPAIRASYAWSCVPLIANIPLWFVLAYLFGEQLFTTFSEGSYLTNAQVALFFSIMLVRIVAAVWSIVIYLNALAEVQQFSILRAIGNVLLSGVICGVIAYILLEILFRSMGESATAMLPFFQTIAG